MHIVPYGGAVHAPIIFDSHNHLFELTTLTYNYQFPRDTKTTITLSHVNLRTSHPKTAHGVANRRHMAQRETTETPDNGGYGDITTPNTHAEEHRLIPYSATQLHSGSGTKYVSGYPIARASDNKTMHNHHTHPCKQNAPNTHMHKLGLTH